MRLLFLLLLLANLAFFASMQMLERRREAAVSLSLLEISPEKVRPVVPGKAAAPKPKPKPELAVCLEWGPFAADVRAQAQAAVADLVPAERLASREVAPVYWIRIAGLRTRADADKKAGELRALGVADFQIMPEAGGTFAVSLGLFRNEEGAKSHFAALRQKGVRTAVLTPQDGGPVLVIREPADAVAARISELAKSLGGEVKAGVCAEPVKG